MGGLNFTKVSLVIAAIAWLAAQGISPQAPNPVVSETAKQTVEKAQVGIGGGVQMLIPPVPLVLTKNGVVTVGVQSPDKLPQIEVQIGRVKGERLFATIGVGTDVAATDVGVDMASALSKALSTVRARIDQNVQNCVVDGPCAKTCMDEKTKKPYCCKFECAK